MSEHAAQFHLDAYAAGDRNEQVTGHLETCEACTDYVEKARALAAAFSENEGAKAAEFVLALDDERRAGSGDAVVDERGRPERPRLSRRAAWIGGTMMAAAAAPRLVRTSSENTGPSSVSSEPSVRFKGKQQIAVIRDRRGEQSRITTEVRVRPGDQIRAEISVDETRPIEVGFLGKDGTWILLLAPALVEAGTYFSERAARFDESPTEGWVIAGHPEEVSRAKTTRAFDEVSVLPVIAEP